MRDSALLPEMRPTDPQPLAPGAAGGFDYAAWEQANNQFIDTAMTWLRLSLRRYAQLYPSGGPAGERFSLFGARPAADTGDIKQKDVDQALKRMLAAAESVTPAPALHLLGARFGLSDFERNMLLLCAGMELDPGLASLCAAAQGGQASPTFALARGLFADPSWDAFSPERPLRQWRLIEISQPGAQPLTTSPLRADERIVSFIKGLNYIDDRLAPLLIPFDAPPPGSPGQPPLAPSQQRVANQIAASIRQRLETAGESLLAQMAGADGLSKQLIALEATRQVQVNLFRLPVEWLPQNAAELETLARLWEREAILQPVALYLDAHEAAEVETPEAQAGALERFLARVRGAVFLDTREIRPGLGYRGLALDIEKPLPAEQVAVWSSLLGAAGGDWPYRLAGQFSLNLPTIQQIAGMATGGLEVVPPETAQSRPCDSAADAGAAAWQVCLSRTRPKLDRLAQRIEPKAQWGDIELPDEPQGLLQEIVGQVQQRLTVYENWGLREVLNRGLGISALFAGESGTGKTMAAEVIANALCLNLYRIDLSAVVSKYIGETEKNLRRLFDAAEDGGVILFFDEADALFGKRSEVKDSHDRYANIEVNYLLQRMEAYHGLAILATNMKSALDQAFLRRLRFIVNFPFPGPDDRQRIWQKAFPPGIPLDALDYERLARFNLTGGSIHNIAVNAAFLAAKQPIPVVTMEQVFQAVRTELRKLEKPFSERDLELSLDAAARQLIWQEATRADAPWLKGLGAAAPGLQAVDLDYAALASFNLSASQIYEAVGRAALQSAGSSGTALIHMGDLLTEVRGALQRLGLPVNESDFPALPAPGGPA